MLLRIWEKYFGVSARNKQPAPENTPPADMYIQLPPGAAAQFDKLGEMFASKDRAEMLSAALWVLTQIAEHGKGAYLVDKTAGRLRELRLHSLGNRQIASAGIETARAPVVLGGLPGSGFDAAYQAGLNAGAMQARQQDAAHAYRQQAMQSSSCWTGRF